MQFHDLRWLGFCGHTQPQKSTEIKTLWIQRHWHYFRKLCDIIHLLYNHLCRESAMDHLTEDGDDSDDDSDIEGEKGNYFLGGGRGGMREWKTIIFSVNRHLGWDRWKLKVIYNNLLVDIMKCFHSRVL